VPEDLRYDVSLNLSETFGGVSETLPKVAFEGAIGAKNSWTANAFVFPQAYSGYSYTELGLGGSYRWWIGSYLPRTPSRALRGIFLGPRVEVVDYNINYDYYVGATKYSTGVSAVGFGVGAEAGYQYIFRPGLMVNAGLTATYVIVSANFQYGSSYAFGGLAVGPQASVGYAF
jgi:hypothetical protein